MKLINTYCCMLLFSFITTCFLSSCNSSPTTSKVITQTPEDTLVQIPDYWIKKLRTIKDFSKSRAAMVDSFYIFLYPEKKDTLLKKPSQTSSVVLNPLFVNLDESPTDELLMLIGDSFSPLFVIVKQINHKWYLLYATFAIVTRSFNDIVVHNTSPRKKVFYVNLTCGWGSGYGCNKRHFFRIENNRAKRVLSVANHTGYSTMGRIFGKSVQTTTDMITLNMIGIQYHYTFTPGTMLMGSVTETPSLYTLEALKRPFLKGEKYIYYKWNEKTGQYKLKDQQLKNLEYTLNNAGTNQEFYKAFRPTLDSLKTKGNGYLYSRQITGKIVSLILKYPKDYAGFPMDNDPPVDYYQIRVLRTKQKNKH